MNIPDIKWTVISISFLLISATQSYAQTGTVVTQYNPASVNNSGFNSTLTFEYRFGAIVGQPAVWLRLSGLQIQPTTYQYQGKLYDGNAWVSSYRYNYLDLEVTFGQHANTITRTKRIFPQVGNDEIQFSVKNDFGIDETNPEILNTFRVFSIRVYHHYSDSDQQIGQEIRNIEAEKAREAQSPPVTPPVTPVVPPTTPPSGTPPTQQQTPPENPNSAMINQLLNQASSQFQQGNYSGSLASLRAAQQLDPENAAIQQMINSVTEVQQRENELRQQQMMKAQEETISRAADVTTTIATDMLSSGGQFGIFLSGPDSDDELLTYGITWGEFDFIHLNISSDFKRLFNISLDLMSLNTDALFGFKPGDVVFRLFPSIGAAMDFGSDQTISATSIDDDYSVVQLGIGALIGNQSFYLKFNYSFNVLDIDKSEFANPRPWFGFGIGIGGF